VNIIIGSISLLLAIAIGAYRQNCIFWENKLPYNCPLLWKTSATFRLLSWLATTLFSILAAFIFATLLVDEASEFVGKFSFGVLLFIRWLTSLLIGQSSAYSQFAEIEKGMMEKDME